MTSHANSTLQRLPDHSVTGDSNKTVFLLHGAFGAKEYWVYQTAALVQAGYRVVAWDAPGYGLSPMPEEFSIESAAQACVALIKSLGSEINIVLGHSMGGMIAQRTFEYCPTEIHGLILSSTSAAFGSSDGAWQKKFVADRVAPLDAGKTIPEYAPIMLEKMFGPGVAGEGTELVTQVIAKMREETFRAAIQAVTKYEGRDILSKINVPTLCIAGEHDASAAPPSVMEKMASKIANAEFVCMSGVGHFGWAENPRAYNEYMLSFLQRYFNGPSNNNREEISHARKTPT